MKTFFRAAALTVGLATIPLCAVAAINTVFGIDYGAGPTTPLPASNAAAATFAQSAGITVDLELLSTGSFTSSVIAPGVVAVYGPAFGDFPPAIASATGSPRGGFNTTSGGSNYIQLAGGAITFNFASPILGFGAYITGMNANGASFEFNDGAAQIIRFSDLFYPGIFGGAAFVGFSSTASPFSSVTFRTTNELGVADYVAIDDLRVLSAIPEPSQAGLLCAGLLAVLTARVLGRRKR
jgi:hypothetical protein